MNRQPLFIDAGGLTIRINPRTSPTSYICMQIMEPPEFDHNQRDPVLVREGKFTQLFLSKEQAKAVADILHAEAVLELVNDQ